jgi:hypothetical protein
LVKSGTKVDGKCRFFAAGNGVDELPCKLKIVCVCVLAGLKALSPLVCVSLNCKEAVEFFVPAEDFFSRKGDAALLSTSL